MAAREWSKVSDMTVERLLSADSYYLYAYDGNKILATADMQTWIAQGTANLNMLPDRYVTTVAQCQYRACHHGRTLSQQR